MKVAIPVAEDRGLESLVYAHFGSAPLFVLVDPETMCMESLGNRDQTHAHGQCSPMKALAGTRPDAVVVGGIGAGALLGLRQAGIRVYQAAGKTVADVVSLLSNNGLKELSLEGTCAGHGGGSGCPHSHD